MLEKFKDQAALGSANLISSIMTSLFWIFLASVLSKESYGELGFLFAIAYTGWAITNVGIDRLIIVYGAKNENIYQPAYAFSIITSIIVSTAVYFVYQNIESSILIWGFMIYSVYIAQLNSKKKFFDLAKNIILYRFLTIAFSLLLYLVLDINGIILGAALASIPASKWIYDFLKTEKISIKVLRPKLKFMLNNYASVLALTLFVSGDKILISHLYGFSILGSYIFMLQYVYVLNALPVSLMMYLLPNEAQNLDNKKFKIYSIVLSVILAFLLILVAPYIVEMFFPQFEETIFPMQITSIGIIPWVISIIFEAQFLGKEKTKIVLFSSSIQTGLYFILIMFFGTQFGLSGLAVAFLTSISVRCIINLAYSFKINHS